MKEIWKDIPEYEELYQISNLGRVRSKDRLIKVNCQNNSHVKRPFFYYVYPGRIIKLQTNKFGYTTVFLNKGGKQIGAFQSNIWKAIHNGKKCNGYYWKYKEE